MLRRVDFDTGEEPDGSRAPNDLYRVIAADRAARWDYAHTLDAADLAAYIRVQSEDPNLRADADTAWRAGRAARLAERDRLRETNDELTLDLATAVNDADALRIANERLTAERDALRAFVEPAKAVKDLRRQLDQVQEQRTRSLSLEAVEQRTRAENAEAERDSVRDALAAANAAIDRVRVKCQRWIDAAERDVGPGEYGTAGRVILAALAADDGEDRDVHL